MFDERVEKVAQNTVVQAGLHGKDSFEIDDVVRIDVADEELTLWMWDVFVWRDEWHRDGLEQNKRTVGTGDKGDVRMSRVDP